MGAIADKLFSIELDPKQRLEGELGNYEVGAPDTSKRYTFTEKEVDWKALGHYGLTKDFADKNGITGELLTGERSRMMPLVFEVKGQKVPGEGKLQLTRNPENGEIFLRAHPLRTGEVLNQEYKGHTFTPEQQKNLLETGHMGEIAYLSVRGSLDKVPHFVSLEPDTKEPMCCRVDRVKIPPQIKGATIDPEKWAQLMAGKEVRLENLQGRKGPYPVNVRVDANTGRLDFRFDEPRQNQAIPTRLGGQPLTVEMQKALADGKTIIVKDMIGKNGKPLPEGVAWDFNKNKPRFFKPKQDQSAEVKEGAAQSPDAPAQGSGQTPDAPSQGAGKKPDGPDKKPDGPDGKPGKKQNEKPETPAPKQNKPKIKR